MSRKKLLLLLLLFAALRSYGQKEMDTWYFGYRAGLKFSNGKVIPLSDGAINTVEGCSGISDTSGNLLFYTDGVTVWDRTHHPMPNGTGLHGHFSSTQSAIVVKKPRSLNLYYVFTVDCAEDSMKKGLQYSIVDMTLNNGYGDIISKNNVVYTPTGEKLTAVKQKGRNAVWVITYSYSTGELFSYQLTDKGLSANPVKSSLPTSPYITFRDLIGYMKVSPDGKKIALASELDGTILVYNFDALSGRLGKRYTRIGTNSPYGIEFSPDSRKLYASESTTWLRQYNLDSLEGDSILFLSTKNYIPYRYTLDSSSYVLGALQSGPDGKIYVTVASDYVGVVDYPDSLGKSSAFVDTAIRMNKGAQSELGLPAFMPSYFYSFFQYQNTCFGSRTAFSISDTGRIDSIRWNFGDSASKNANISSTYHPTHIFTNTGKYRVSIITYADGIRLDDTVEVSIVKPRINLGKDTAICCICNDSISLHVSCKECSYSWDDGTTHPTRKITQPGSYWVTAYAGGCSASDTINISRVDKDLLPYKDTAVCDSFTIIARYAGGNNHFRWQDGSSGNRFTAFSSGKFYVTASNDCASMTDTVNLIVNNCDCYLYIPNSFSPDNNGINEIFRPSLCSARNYELEIFNRWGERLFDTENLHTGWDGKFDGKQVPDGPYIYRIKGQNFDTGFFDKKGIVYVVSPSR